MIKTWFWNWYTNHLQNDYLIMEHLSSNKKKNNDKDVHSHHFYSANFECLATYSTRRKEIETQTEKEVKPSLLAGNMMPYIIILKVLAM